MIGKNDWRIQGQEKYLKGANLYYQKYTRYSDEWDHDHCEFCGETFSEYDGHLHYGYCTQDEYYWICKQCFNDFKDMFNWELINEQKENTSIVKSNLPVGKHWDYRSGEGIKYILLPDNITIYKDNSRK